MSDPTRVWFITGASQGLGRALLDEVLVSGERVVATLRRPEQLASLSSTYPLSQLLILKLDITNQAEITDALDAGARHFGQIDIIVNNAGYALEGEIEATSEEDARKQMEVAFWGPVHVTKEAIRILRDVNPAGQGGRVLNISSMCGYSSNPTLAYYCAGKFALEAFTEALVKEMLPEWNITGVLIQPGGFRTEWSKGSMVRIPVHPKYDMPESPTMQFRRMIEKTYIGDPTKGARAIIKIANMPDPPLRIQLGTESLLVVRNKAMKTIQDGERYAELAHSTNADGVDKEAVLETFKEVNS